MQRYAITDRSLSQGPHAPGVLSREERAALLGWAQRWAAAGVEYVQLREKDLRPSALAELTAELGATLSGSSTRLLVNGHPEMAAEVAEVAGVHLPEAWTTASLRAVRALFAARGRECIVSVACHTLEGPALALRAGADLALFAPVFRPFKGPASDSPGARPGWGLAGLRAACAGAPDFPVFALGGVTTENAGACADAGAAGVAAIRMFAR